MSSPFTAAPLAIVDIETISLDRRRGVPYEAGLILLDEGWNVEAEYEWWLPHSLRYADPASLAVGRYWARRPTDPERYVDLGTWAQEFSALTAGRHLVGLNPAFDEVRLEALVRDHGGCLSTHYHLVDVEALAAGALGQRPPWRSTDLAAELGVEVIPEEKHTALGDCRLTHRMLVAVYDIELVGSVDEPARESAPPATIDLRRLDPAVRAAQDAAAAAPEPSAVPVSEPAPAVVGEVGVVAAVEPAVPAVSGNDLVVDDPEPASGNRPEVGPDEQWSGYEIDPDHREGLLKLLTDDGFGPLFRDVDLDHVTVAFPATELPPEIEGVKIMGVANNGGVQALLVAIDGSINRPGGGYYHVTYSLAEGWLPVHSNDLLEQAVPDSVTWIGPYSVRVTPFLRPIGEELPEAAAPEIAPATEEPSPPEPMPQPEPDADDGVIAAVVPRPKATPAPPAAPEAEAPAEPAEEATEDDPSRRPPGMPGPDEQLACEDCGGLTELADGPGKPSQAQLSWMRCRHIYDKACFVGRKF